MKKSILAIALVLTQTAHAIDAAGVCESVVISAEKAQEMRNQGMPRSQAMELVARLDGFAYDLGSMATNAAYNYNLLASFVPAGVYYTCRVQVALYRPLTYWN
jgi:hypothetical protein